MSKEIEYRNCRAEHIETREENGAGIFEGYACLWNQVDDYNSVFERGAFSKTLSERANKVKIMYSHKDPVGKPMELREDEKGLFIRGQLSLGVEKADEAFKLMKDGVIDTLSLGFNTVSDYYKAGVRYIREAKLFEVSPVVFASNENAMITDVRSMNFKETMNEVVVSRMGYSLLESLQRTMDDIWYNAKDNNEMMSACNKACDQFKASWMSYAQAYVDTFRAQDQKRSIFGGDTAIELRKHCEVQNMSIEEMAKQSVFSIDELNGLLSGNLSIPAEKLAKLPENIRAAYQKQQNASMEQMCSGLRESGMTNTDKVRLAALLNITSQPDAVQSAISKWQEYRTKLAG